MRTKLPVQLQQYVSGNGNVFGTLRLTKATGGTSMVPIFLSDKPGDVVRLGKGISPEHGADITRQFMSFPDRSWAMAHVDEGSEQVQYAVRMKSDLPNIDADQFSSVRVTGGASQLDGVTGYKTFVKATAR